MVSSLEQVIKTDRHVAVNWSSYTTSTLLMIFSFSLQTALYTLLYSMSFCTASAALQWFIHRFLWTKSIVLFCSDEIKKTNSDIQSCMMGVVLPQSVVLIIYSLSSNWKILNDLYIDSYERNRLFCSVVMKSRRQTVIFSRAWWVWFFLRVLCSLSIHYLVIGKFDQAVDLHVACSTVTVLIMELIMMKIGMVTEFLNLRRSVMWAKLKGAGERQGWNGDHIEEEYTLYFYYNAKSLLNRPYTHRT